MKDTYKPIYFYTLCTWTYKRKMNDNLVTGYGKVTGRDKHKANHFNFNMASINKCFPVLFVLRKPKL